jgi:NTE family protein
LKRALVFSGGGAKGSYEIGVWKAIKRLNMKFDIVTGTSIGAINGAFYAMGDYQKAKKLWLNMTTSDLFTSDDIKVMAKEIATNKGMKFDKATEFLKKVIDENKIRKSKIDFGLVTVSLKTLNPKMLTKDQIPQGKLVDYVIASSTCFPAVEKKQIDGEYFVDGGYYDNMPIDLAIKMGAEEVLAVDLSAFGFRKNYKDKDVKIDIIKSKDNALFTLDFSSELTKRNIKLGYNDTMKYFKKLDGNNFTFKKGEIHKNYLKIKMNYIYHINKLVSNSKKSKIKNKIFEITKYNKLLLDINSDNDLEDYMLEYLEYLGKVFELDNTKIYTVSKFNKKILEKLNTKEEIKYNINLKGKLLINHIYNKYRENQNSEEIFNLAVLFPKEFLATIYLIVNS